MKLIFASFLLFLNSNHPLFAAEKKIKPCSTLQYKKLELKTQEKKQKAMLQIRPSGGAAISGDNRAKIETNVGQLKTAIDTLEEELRRHKVDCSQL